MMESDPSVRAPQELRALIARSRLQHLAIEEIEALTNRLIDQGATSPALLELATDLATARVDRYEEARPYLDRVALEWGIVMSDAEAAETAVQPIVEKIARGSVDPFTGGAEVWAAFTMHHLPIPFPLDEIAYQAVQFDDWLAGPDRSAAASVIVEYAKQYVRDRRRSQAAGG